VLQFNRNRVILHDRHCNSIFSPYFLHPLPKIERWFIAVIATWEQKTLNYWINPLEKKMKKSLLNIAVSIAMSGTLLSASLLSSQAYADEAAAAAVSSVDSNEETSLKTYLYPGMGVGAATGTVVAGPIGFVIGGLIGAFVGAGQEVGDTTSPLTESDVIAENSLQHDNLADEVDQTETVLPGIQLAQIGEIDAVFTDSNDIHQDVPKDELIDSLTTDLGLDVYFRSGSSNIESFYPARLSAIASLLNSLDRLGSEKLALHLDGYSDRRGDQAKNIALANERIEKVRQQLIAAGVAEERISGKAFGEMKMVSTAGDLEGYTFDRKVVIRFERAATDPVHEMAAAFSALPSEAPAIEVTAIVDSAIETPVIENPAVTANDSSINPVVAEAGSRF